MAKKRIQLDLDDVGRMQLLTLQHDGGSASYSETIRKLLDLGTYLRAEVLADKSQLDLNIIRQLFFSRTE